MATVKYGPSYHPDTPFVSKGSVKLTLQTNAALHYKAGDFLLKYSGSFTLDNLGNVKGGSIQDWEVTLKGRNFFLAEDIFVNSDKVISFTKAGNFSDLTQLIFDDDDHFTGSRFDDSILGFNGNDHISGEAGNDELIGDTGDDELIGGKGDDLLRGNQGDDFLDGGSGSDLLLGGAGDDVLKGRTGSNVLRGGGGNDTYQIETKKDQVVEKAGQGDDDKVQSKINYTLPSEVESLFLLGDDDLNGNGNELRNRLIGNNGDNRLAGKGENDQLHGFAGHDVLLGGAGSDRLFGHKGKDYLDGGAGKDRMFGGEGSDTFIVNHPKDYVQEANHNGGYDIILTSVDFTITDANDAVEEVKFVGSDDLNGTGNFKANLIRGNDGNNFLDGGGGGDTLLGEGGDDHLLGADSHDRLFGGDGDDILDSGSGLLGNDRLDGGDGNDTLIAGDGFDRLTGGAGDDVFVLKDNGSRDKITDFLNGADLLDLTDFGLSSGNDALALATDNGHTTNITFGSGTKITLSNVLITDLDATDFIV